MWFFLMLVLTLHAKLVSYRLVTYCCKYCQSSVGFWERISFYIANKSKTLNVK